MPLQFMLCAEAQDRIRRAGKEELMGTPIGQLVGWYLEAAPHGVDLGALEPRVPELLRGLPDPHISARIVDVVGRIHRDADAG